MKILPKGSNPPINETTEGVRYHFFSGIGRGIVFTRQGLLGAPLQFLPTTVPRRASGKEIKPQITKTTTIVPNGIAARDPYNMATVFRMKPIPKHKNGKSDAVKIIDFIHVFPEKKKS